MPNRIKFCRGIDTWSIVHLLGCYLLMSVMQSWLTVLLFGIVWEFMDYLYSCVKYEVPEWFSMILDPRGADLMDVVFDVAGIGLYLLFIYLNFI